MFSIFFKLTITKSGFKMWCTCMFFSVLVYFPFFGQILRQINRLICYIVHLTTNLLEPQRFVNTKVKCYRLCGILNFNFKWHLDEFQFFFHEDTTFPRKYAKVFFLSIIHIYMYMYNLELGLLSRGISFLL